MVLVDTSVWVDHFNGRESGLVSLLENGDVFCHPLIVGELACGGMKNRDEILSLLDVLPKADVAEHAEVLQFLEQHSLHGKGLGYIDVSLLAACLLSEVQLWTKDKRLQAVAKRFEVNYT